MTTGMKLVKTCGQRNKSKDISKCYATRWIEDRRINLDIIVGWLRIVNIKEAEKTYSVTTLAAINENR